MSATSWENGTSGNWAIGANWSTDAVPTAASTATISVAGTYTVTVSTADVASTLTLNNDTATLDIVSGGTLTLDTTLTATAGTIDLFGSTVTASSLTNSGTITGFGTLAAGITNNGTIEASGGTLEINGSVTTDGTLQADTGATLFVSGFGFGNNGTINVNGGTLNASSVTNASGGTIDVNSGTVSASIVNTGAIDLNGGTVSGTTLNNNAGGTIDLHGGTVSMTIATNSAGGTVDINGGMVSATIVNNSGAIDLNGGTVLGTFVNNDAGGTIIGQGTVLSAQPNTNTGTIEASVSGGTLTITQAITNTGTAQANAGATLNFSSGVTNSGAIDLSGGTVTAWSLTDSGTIAGFGTVASAIANAGAIVASGGLLTISGAVTGTGTATVDSGATLAFGSSVGEDQAVTLGAHAQLDLAAPSSFAGTIDGMSSSDTIDLTGVAFDSAGTAKLLAGNKLAVSEHGTVYDLQFNPSQSFATEFFHLASDLAGTGTDVTEISQPCYCRGTRILTTGGETPVEELQIGDLVMTASGVARPIKWLGRRGYSGRFVLGRKDVLPVCIKAGALDDNVPQRDLWLSPQHAMYLDGMLIEARDLVNGVSIIQVASVDEVEYFHIELETHDVLVAEGAPAESFIDDNSRGMFHNVDEYRMLYPEAADGPAQYCAPRCYEGYELDAVRRRIEARAGIRTEAPSFEGRVDLATPGRIAGWAQNTRHKEAPVCVDIYVGGQLIGRTLANRYRADLERAGLGSGNHSFKFTPPEGLVFTPGAVEVRCSLDGAVLPFSRSASRKLAAI